MKTEEDEEFEQIEKKRQSLRSMNERIRELADEAGLRFTQLMSNPMVPVVGFGKETDLEKFAELIVRECIKQVEPTQHHEVWAQSYLGGVDGLDLLSSKIKDIKRHFGVELDVNETLRNRSTYFGNDI